MSKPDIVAIVSHDAGGAEILSSWANLNSSHCLLVLAGPAISIFSRKCEGFEQTSLDEALERCDWLLCGTGWQSDFERLAISLGRKANKKTIAFLDHWVNYRARFLDEGSEIFPDEIWVGDTYARQIAELEFPEINVLQKPNPYLDELLLEIDGFDKKKLDSEKPSILYVCEPVREHALKYYGDERYWGYTEEEALNYFLKNLQELNLGCFDIVLRPHPSESVQKYDWALSASEHSVRISADSSLISDIANASVVVGCESMAMVVALLAKRRVFSAIPIGGRRCQLPHKGIEHLSDFVPAVS